MSGRDYHSQVIKPLCEAALPESWDPAAEIDRDIKRLTERAKVLRSFGVDDFEDGATVTWTRTFRDTNRVGNRLYTYVALKGGGRWWITGKEGHRGLIYQDLVEEHLANADADSIAIVAKWAVFE